MDFKNNVNAIIGKYDKLSFFIDFDTRHTHGNSTIKNEINFRAIILRSIICRGSHFGCNEIGVKIYNTQVSLQNRIKSFQHFELKVLRHIHI